MIALMAAQLCLTAQNMGKLKKQADIYFENKAYTKALYYYTQYDNQKGLDKEGRYNMAVSSYEVNDLSDAQKILTSLLEVKNFEPKTYFYLARLAHVRQDFDKAEQLYKKYLANTSEDGNAILEVRNYIRNCNVGNRLLSLPEEALVENLGRNINSQYDEFAAIQSPNYADKIYYSSARKGSQGGLRNARGQRDTEYGKYNSDIFYSKIENGLWVPATPMGGLLNSEDKDVLLGFSSAGNVSYLFKGDNYEEGQLLVDTFVINQEEAKLPTIFQSPINMEEGDSHPYFYNDSLVLFSSYRKGGYGGYDLYAMVQKDKEWSQPFNLGPEVNSVFDEQNPFLARDGRSLYFSSNNCRKSLGGFDIFSAHFDESSKMWGNVKNMGMPINSADNDTHFYLASDGTKAYLSSDRKSGYGERDIYIAYFKHARADQMQTSQPITFIQLEDKAKRLAISQQIISGNGSSSVGVSFEEEEKVDIPQEVTIESMFYTSDRDLLSEANKRKIDVVTELLKLDNTLTLRIECHSTISGPLPFDMYFSVKRAEKIAQSIMSNGIPARKIHIVGYGPLYPIALNEINGIENQIGRQLNNRVDFKIQGKGQAGIDVQYSLPVVSKFQIDQRGGQLEGSQQGLKYKIKIASTNQMFNDEILDQLPDPSVGKRMVEDKYTYTVGSFKLFSTAKEFKKELVKFKLIDTEIIPFIDGEKISKNQGMIFLEKYPDLQYYFKAVE